MTNVTFRTDFRVDVADVMGDDSTILHIARVGDPEDWPIPDNFEPDSQGRMQPVWSEKDKGLMRMLMRDRHGSPFEHVVFQLYIETPIFVNREFFRHRMASYNETSARYRVLEPVFYMPPVAVRPLVQEGKPGAYVFKPGNGEQMFYARSSIADAARYAWAEYQSMLDRGIAREVARSVLPVNVYSPFYVTMNLRSLFNFLSLREKTEDTTVPTFPQWEIAQVAHKIEEAVTGAVPLAMSLFNELGRVSP